MDIVSRFVNYVRIDTQSDEYSESVPSTQKQFNLAKLLKNELEQLGLADIYLSEQCVLYAKLPANCDSEDKIGFVAHMDTSSACSGANVKPKLVKNYKGSKITLNEELGIYLDPEQFPILKKDIGCDLIVTDGTTLLGGDDKAGVAIIMDLMQYLSNHPEVKHGQISIAFTPDEEIGRGVENFDVERFDAQYAYTIDGDDCDGLCYECFNASAAEVIIKGLSIHPGSAKNQMLNALLVAMEFQNQLPVNENPMYTEGYEGFYHLCDMSGDCEEVKMHYILRDHDSAKLKGRKDFMTNLANYLNQKYGAGTVVVNISDTYYNMREIIEQHPEVIERVQKAMQKLAMTPKVEAIRGGTDGANLTFKGLPCPNLGTGDRNCHGRYEYVNVQHMKMMVKLLEEIVTINQ